MSFYNTGNPVPSIDPRDLDDNAKHIDEIVNSSSPTFTDRLGAERITLSGIVDMAGPIGEQVEAAQEAAVQAESAADRSESSASLAAAFHNPFLNTADGIGNTSGSGATNRFFSVLVAGSSTLYTAYRNDAGVPVTIGQAPSASIVSRLESGDFSGVGMQLVRLAPESGYAWALVDSAMRAALLIALDGSVVIPKLGGLPAGSVLRETLTPDLAGFVAQPMSPETGYVWAVLDGQGRIGLGLTVEGKLVCNLLNLPSVEGLAYLQPSKNLWCLGDSLTNGSGGQVTWRERLATDFPSKTITNWAVGGQTSSQIAARAGSYVSLLTVTNNTIPASGGVSITARSISLLTSQGFQSIPGWLAGIAGSLSRASDDSYTFTRAQAGSATFCAPGTPFVPDVAGHDFDTFIIFIGANNLIAPEDIKRDIEACVNFQKPAEKRYLIITPPLGGPITPGVPTDVGIGTGTYDRLKIVENWAVQKYGGNVLRVREYLQQFHNGSADDLDDVARGVVPRSLRIDTIHFTTAAHSHIADLIAFEIYRRGW